MTIFRKPIDFSAFINISFCHNVITSQIGIVPVKPRIFTFTLGKTKTSKENLCQNSKSTFEITILSLFLVKHSIFGKNLARAIFADLA
jgi:hypothetical protein